MKVALILFSLIWVPCLAFCQYDVPKAIIPSSHPLRVGDTLPDISLKMINYKSENESIKNFRGKYLLLDFWSTFCKSCIEMMPKMERLQMEFGDDLTILPTTSFYKKDYIESFFKNQIRLGHIKSLPSTVEADTLFKIFPSFGLPHEVWIDRNGIVIGITDESAVTEDVIRAVISGRIKTLPSETYNHVDFTKPLLTDGNGGPDDLFDYRSMITRYIPGTSITETRVKTPTSIKITKGNATPIELVVWALRNSKKIPSDVDVARSILVDSSSVYKEYKRQTNLGFFEEHDFRSKKLFNYELWLPSTFSLTEADEIVLQDIKRFFKINYSEKKVQKQTLAIYEIDTRRQNLKSKGNRQKIFNTDTSTVFKSVKLSTVIQYLNTSKVSLPLVVDKTKIDYLIDIEISNTGGAPLTVLQEHFKKSGLAITPEVNYVNTIVIK